MNKEKTDSPELSNLWNEIQSLNERLSAIEETLQNLKISGVQMGNQTPVSTDGEFEFKLPFQSEGAFEFRVGEYGMAWLGNIVLLFGITFLVQYLQNSGYVGLSVLTGFISIALIYLAALFTSKLYAYLSKLFTYNGHFLLYYFVLKLHFFEASPVIKNQLAALFILLVVVGVLFFLAVRRQSQIMSFMVLIMLVFAGIACNSTIITAGIITTAAISALFLYNRFAWSKLYLSSVILIWLGHFIWLLNNPIMGNSFEFISSPGFSTAFIFITGFVFSLLAFLPKKKNISDEFVIVSIVVNGLIFTALLLMMTFTFYLNQYVLLFGTITVFCLIFSVVLKKKSLYDLIASMYVLYGFMAMSVSFYGLYLFPKAYLLFSLQSLLVVSVALWFRSRFMVIMNTLLFLLLMVFYIQNPAHISSTDFSFMLVAFVTARIINWKKERLNIRTELVRNVYLICGFVMTLFSFYYAFPEAYITVSWIFAAILFFLLSRLIKNIKYRWLAIAMVIASAIKLIFVDLSNVDIGYRVLVFLLLALISITVSILYTKYFRK